MQLKSHKTTQIREKPLKIKQTHTSIILRLEKQPSCTGHTLLTSSGIWSRGKPGSLHLRGFLVSTLWVPGATTTTWSTWTTWDKGKDKALMQKEKGLDFSQTRVLIDQAAA